MKASELIKEIEKQPGFADDPQVMSQEREREIAAELIILIAGINGSIHSLGLSSKRVGALITGLEDGKEQGE